MSAGPQEEVLDKLLAYAEGYAEFSMRKLGRVPPSLLAISPKGSIHFIPANLKDVRAKDTFANTALRHQTAVAVNKNFRSYSRLPDWPDGELETSDAGLTVPP